MAVKTLVVYDIPSDKIRVRIAEACKDYGLQRVQWSAFLGELTHTRREELGLRLRRVLGRFTGNVQLYPICDKDLALHVEIAVKGEGGTPKAEGGGGKGDKEKTKGKPCQAGKGKAKSGAAQAGKGKAKSGAAQAGKRKATAKAGEGWA